MIYNTYEYGTGTVGKNWFRRCLFTRWLRRLDLNWPIYDVVSTVSLNHAAGCYTGGGQGRPTHLMWKIGHGKVTGMKNDTLYTYCISYKGYPVTDTIWWLDGLLRIPFRSILINRKGIRDPSVKYWSIVTVFGIAPRSIHPCTEGGCICIVPIFFQWIYNGIYFFEWGLK